MYEAHAARSEPDSTDWAILSPHVPVFCSDAGSLLERLWSESFITSAAAYAPYGPAPGGRLLDHRIRRVLDVAPAHGYSALVVGRGAAAPSATTPTERPRTSGDTSMSCQTLSNMWSLSSLTGPTTAGTWGHSPRRSEPPLADEWPPEGLGTQVSGRDPTTGAAGEPAPVRPQGRPSVPDPRAAAPRARAPERPAGHQARGVPAGRRPGLGRHHRLARPPAAPLDVPGQRPGSGTADRRARHRRVPRLPGSPRSPGLAGAGPSGSGRPTCSPGFDTHRISNGGTEAVNLIIEKTRRLAHGSGRSSTTGYGSCSQPQEPAPTGSSRQCLVPKSRPKGLMLHVSGYGPVRRSKLVHG